MRLDLGLRCPAPDLDMAEAPVSVERHSFNQAGKTARHGRRELVLRVARRDHFRVPFQASVRTT